MGKNDDNLCKCQYKVRSQRAKCVMAWCYIAVIVLSLILLFSPVVAIINLFQGVPFLQAVVGWNNEAIINVRKQPLNTECEPNQEFFSYKFPGTSASCDCGASGVESGQCSSSSCNDIPSLGALTFQNWGDNQEGYKLCGIVAQGVNFIKNHPIDGQCPSGSRFCGTDSDYGICMPNAFSECPYQNFQRAPAPPPQDANATTPTTPPGPEYQLYLPIEGTNMVGARNLPSYNPIGNIRVHQGPVCLDNIDGIYNTGQSTYKNEPFKCGKIQLSFTEADTIPAFQFYRYNGQSKLAAAPSFVGYPPYNYIQMTMWNRPYVLWKNKCRADKAVDTIVEQAINLWSIFQSNMAMLYMAFILIIYLILFPIAMCCEFCRQGDKDNSGTFKCCCGCSACPCWKRCWNKREPKKRCTDHCTMIDPCVFFFFLIHWLIILSYFFTSIAANAQSTGFSDFITTYQNKDCSTPQINTSIKDLSNSFSMAVDVQKRGLTITIIFLIVESVILCGFLRGVVNVRRKSFKKAKKSNNRISSIDSLDESRLDKLAGPNAYELPNITNATNVYVGQIYQPQAPPPLPPQQYQPNMYNQYPPPNSHPYGHPQYPQQYPPQNQYGAAPPPGNYYPGGPQPVVGQPVYGGQQYNQ